MTAKRQTDGSYVYRGQRIVPNPNIRPGKLGRYSVDGVPFAQLETARDYIDVLAKHDLQELDPLV